LISKEVGYGIYGYPLHDQLAREFGKLVNVLWRESYKYVAPSSLKNTISRFAPRFSGYDQHDAQVCNIEPRVYLMCHFDDLVTAGSQNVKMLKMIC
jgi:hypothetical protein